MASLPPLIGREEIARRLPLIFPEGTLNRGYCTRMLSASTVFAMLYIGAVEGADRYMAPVHVYRMSDGQAALTDEAERLAYSARAIARDFQSRGERWYADNTREPIRDETLRDGLVAIGAVIRREDLPTTSSRPRYALKKDFAALFAPNLSETEFLAAVSQFQLRHLSASALARVSIMLSGAAGRTDGVTVTFPGGETRRLAPGPSSIISKAVIEEFAPRFLGHPVVLWVSESGNKVVKRDDQLAGKIGLKIEADKDLPDIILIDLGPEEPLIVFIEVVATDGPINERRQKALWDISDKGHFSRAQVAFLTAYQDRGAQSFRRTVSALAWGSFVWFASEPENIVLLSGGKASASRLSELLKSQ